MKKPTLSRLKKKLWELCKQITRKRYGNSCYTCGKTNLEGGEQQTGHGKPNGALPLRFKYDVRNLRIQCLNCNLNLGGCSDIFIAKLEKEKDGLSFLKEACVKVDGYWEIRHEPPMGSAEAYQFVLDQIEEYSKLSDTA